MEIQDFLDMYTADPEKTKKLTSLNLQDNELTDLPIELFELTKLKELYLDGNFLTQIPHGIGNLMNHLKWM